MRYSRGGGRKGQDAGIAYARMGLSNSPISGSGGVLKHLNATEAMMELGGQKDLLPLIQGPIRVGYLIDDVVYSVSGGQFFGIYPSDSPKTFLILGLPDAGKTNAFCVIISEILEHTNATVVVIDVKGDLTARLWNYARDRLSLEEMLFLDVTRNYRENLFSSPDPERIPPSVWDRTICSVLRHAFGIQLESETALLTGVTATRREMSSEEDPTFFDVYPKIAHIIPKSIHQREQAKYFSRAQYRILMALTNAPYLFSYRRGFPFEEYRKRKLIVLNCKRCDDPTSLRLITESLQTKITTYARYIDPSNEGMSWAIFYDEAERYFSQYETFRGPNPLEEQLRQTRAEEVWVFIGNQTGSTLSRGVRTLTGIKVLMSIDEEELRLIVPGMGLPLTPETYQRVRSLEKGDGIVKLYTHPEVPPFCIHVPEFVSDDTCDEEELHRIFDSVVSEYEYDLVPEEKKQRILSQIYHEISRTDKEGTPKETSQARSDDEWAKALLLSFAQHPQLSTMTHYQAVGIDKARGATIKRVLLERGLIEEYRFRLDPSAKGRPPTRPWPTRAGWEFLVDAGLWSASKPFLEGKGGLVHSLCGQETMSCVERLGLNAELEPDGGTDVDVGGYDPKINRKVVGVNICVTTPPEHELRKLVEAVAGWETAVLVMIKVKEMVPKSEAKSNKSQIDASTRTITLDDEGAEQKKRDFVGFLEASGQEVPGRSHVLTWKEFKTWIASFQQEQEDQNERDA